MLVTNLTDGCAANPRARFYFAAHGRFHQAVMKGIAQTREKVKATLTGTVRPIQTDALPRVPYLAAVRTRSRGD